MTDRKGRLTNEKEATLTRVGILRSDLETLLLAIKEAAVPMLSNPDPTPEAWRTRRFMRLADRMLEDVHDLFAGT